MPFGGLLTVGAIGAGTSLIGGLFGASAAAKAAKAQKEAALAAGRHVEDVTNTVNPNIGATATTAGNQVVDTAGAAANKVTDAGNVAGQGVLTSASQANDLLDPYVSAGKDASDTLHTGLASGGDFNRNFTLNDFQQNDPGFAFRMQQAAQALQRSQAAHGGGLGGGAAKELSRYTQDYASGEFQNAFTRFETQNNDRFSRLNTVAGRGFQAADTSGQNLIGANKYAGDKGFDSAKTAGIFNTDASQYKGNADMHAADLMAANSINSAKASGEYLTQGANAEAAGRVGGANALTSGLTGASNAITGAVTLRQLLANPAVATNPDGSATVNTPSGSYTRKRL